MWSYSGNPSDSEKDAIRFMIGDTKEDSPLSSDEEIEWALAQVGNDLYAAAAIVAKSISTYFATQADSTEIGPIKINYGKRAEYYDKKAEEFEEKSASSSSLNIFCGGIDVAGKLSQSSDSSRVSPYFGRGMMDFSTDVPNE